MQQRVGLFNRYKVVVDNKFYSDNWVGLRAAFTTYGILKSIHKDCIAVVHVNGHIVCKHGYLLTTGGLFDVESADYTADSSIGGV